MGNKQLLGISALSIALLVLIGFTDNVYAELCDQIVNVNTCCDKQECCPGTCTELKKQIRVLRWKIKKLDKRCRGACPGKDELLEELNLVRLELQELQKANEHSVETDVMFFGVLELLEQDVQEIANHVEVLEKDPELWLVGPQLGAILIGSDSCKNYAGVLLGLRLERLLNERVSATGDIELALGRGSSPLGLKLRTGLQTKVLADFLFLEAGLDTLWTSIDRTTHAQELFILGDMGLKLQLRPFFVSGHVMLGGELGHCKSCLAGGGMLHVGLLF